MKKILIITAFVPSNKSAGENFTRHLINDLATNFKIDLVFFKYPQDDNYLIEDDKVRILKVYKNNTLIKFFNILMFPIIFPLFSVRFNIFRLLQLKKILLNNGYNAIIFDFSQTFIFAKFVNHPNIILNCHDVIAQRYSRIYNGILTNLVIASEGYLFKNINAKVFCHSEKDKILLNKLYDVQATVTSLFYQQQILDKWPEFVGDYYVFFGCWKREDNYKGLEWFLNHVLPYINEKIQIKIIGSGLKQKLLNEIQKYRNVEYLGFLEDPYYIISNAKALLSPLFTGAGIKVKVMESLACGTHVIGTRISFEGVPEIFSKYMILAENRTDFIYTIDHFNTNIVEKTELKDVFLKSEIKNAIKDYIITGS